LIEKQRSTSHYNRRKGIKRAGAFLRNVFKKYIDDSCFVKAQALAYTTLLAFVPVAALSFLVFSRFKAFSILEEKVRSFLFKIFLPSQSAKVEVYIAEFLRNTRSLSFFGLISLILAALLLLETIEKTFNEIWGVRERRPFLRRFIGFWGFLSLVPVLLGASFSITAVLGRYFSIETIAPLSWFSYYFIPFLLAFVAFFVAYYFLPYTQVEVKGVLLGACVASILWEIAKYAFDWYISNMMEIGKIYGSLGLIPVFLIWIYIVWLVIFLGAEVAVVYESPLEWGKRGPYSSLQALLEITRHFESGDGIILYRNLVKKLGLSRKKISELLKPLVEKGWIAEIEVGYIMLVPPEKITLYDVSETLELFAKAEGDFPASLSRVAQLLNKGVKRELEKLTLKEIIEWEEER
jgi:YihY family inner membrane protein